MSNSRQLSIYRSSILSENGRVQSLYISLISWPHRLLYHIGLLLISVPVLNIHQTEIMLMKPDLENLNVWGFCQNFSNVTHSK